MSEKLENQGKTQETARNDQVCLKAEDSENVKIPNNAHLLYQHSGGRSGRTRNSKLPYTPSIGKAI